VVGDIFHEVMAIINGMSGSALTLTAFRSHFNNVVKSTHAKIAAAPPSRHLGDPAHWPELVELYRCLSDVVHRRCSGELGRGVSTQAERSLTSRDGLLSGQVDAYFVSDAGIDLVDYKSSPITDDDGSNKQYEEQLYFYAYLIQENHGVYPRSLSLVGRDGEALKLSPSPERSAALATDMRKTLARYNQELADGATLEDLAAPNRDSCLFCDRKAICERYWAALDGLAVPPWNHVAIGLQCTPLVRTPRGGGWFELGVEKSSIHVPVLKLIRVFEQRFPAVDLNQVGQRLFLSGLRALGSTSSVVEATERSTIARLGPTA
jgi:PD-(D/E)XK nuclease superfamily